MNARKISGRMTGEDGGVLITVTLFLPVLLLFISLVVDVGNWFEHKRHLQLQADAGALAGAGLFDRCFVGVASGSAAIDAEMRKYAGDPAAGTYNFQVEDDRNVHVLHNSTLYWNEGGADFTDGGGPCTTGFVDTKITQADLPWFFNVSRVVGAINAHARVSAKQVTSLFGSLPLAIPDIDPKYVKATFVDNATGTPLAGCPNACTVALQKTASTPQDGLWMWSSIGAPLAVPIASAEIGVRFALIESNNAAATCGDPLVSCYEDGATGGVVSIRGWTAGTGAHARDVWLIAGSCAPDAYFSTNACSAGMTADIDLADHPVTGTGVTARVWATVNGTNTEYQLTPPTTGGLWTMSSGIPVSELGSANSIALGWDWEQTTGTWRGLTCRSAGNNPCKDAGSFGAVQRAFLGDFSYSGPIRLAQVGEAGTSSSGANSFQTGTTKDLFVTIGITSLVAAAKASDPTVILRVADGRGNHNNGIDCDAGRNFREEIRDGCFTPYQINPTLTCPSSAVPADCAQILTGDQVGQLRQGMNDRFAGCPPNNWVSADPNTLPTIGASDPRAVPLIITTLGAFDVSNVRLAPVANFATFYVTGWDGATCTNNEPFPGAGSSKGDIWGHFIRHVLAINNGGSGPNACNFNSTALGLCVATLTE